MSPARSYCPQCGIPLSGDGVQFCSDCGAKMPDSRPYAPPQPPPQAPPAAPQPSPQAPPPSAPQPPVPSQFPPGQQPAGYAPQRSQKSVLWLVGAITAVVVVAFCTGSYFLFFAGEPGVKASANTSPARPAETVLPAQTPATTVDVSATSDTTDPPPQTTTTLGQAETVSDKTITVDMRYDSGEGVYTGEIDGSGVPHGQGAFEMVRSDTGKSWSYEGHWENGQITGEGVMAQGDFVFTGTFEGGLLSGACEITDKNVLRYKGECREGKLHGEGALYTKSGALLFQGTFDMDMLVESAAARRARGESFMPKCDDMDEMLYDGCLAEDNTFGLAVAVWGTTLAMGEQLASGTIVIGHFADTGYPVCLVYRYGVDEPKMTRDDWINAWGFVAGTYEYVDGDGLTVTCPVIEVVYWNSEQEGL